MKALVIMVAALALAACGAPTAVKTDQSAAPCAPAPNGGLTVENAWVRAQADAAGVSAAYFTLCNAGVGPVTIAGLASPAAGIVEFHQTTRDGAGVVSMAPTGPITLGPGERIVFEPGGKHAMLMSLSAPIADGAKTTLTLELSNGDRVSADAIARSAVEAAGHAH